MNATTITTHLYFDLFDYVDCMHSVDVAAAVAQSTAWRIDNLIVQESRKLFKYVRDEVAQSSLDQLADITAAMKEAEFTEQCFEEVGGAAEGSCEVIRALNAQRDQWHEFARDLTCKTFDWNFAPRTYEVRDIEAAFHNDKPFKINRDTQRRIKMSVEKRAKVYDWDDETKERSIKRKLERKQDNLEGVRETLTDQAPIVYHMFKLALRSDPSSAAVRPKNFSTLPIEVRRILLANAQDAANRALDWAQDDRSKSDSDIDAIDDEVLNLERKIKAVMSSPDYR